MLQRPRRSNILAPLLRVSRKFRHAPPDEDGADTRAQAARADTWVLPSLLYGIRPDERELRNTVVWLSCGFDRSPSLSTVNEEMVRTYRDHGARNLL